MPYFPFQLIVRIVLLDIKSSGTYEIAIMEKLKLGDSICRGNYNEKNFLRPNSIARNYRVVGINPQPCIQEVFTVKGFQELGEVEVISSESIKKLNLLFPADHLVYGMFGGTWDHIWIGNF